MKTQYNANAKNSLFELRRVINADSTKILNALSKIEWTPETQEGKRDLLNFVGELHDRFDELYKLEYSL